ncbi:MAG: hypothetical protein ACEPOV_13180 [Hyphomicrobiales bacterium]
MNKTLFDQNVEDLFVSQKRIIENKNKLLLIQKDPFSIYENPVISHEHIPIHWRYDLNQQTNPWLQEKIIFNSSLIVGAFRLNNKYYIISKLEGKNTNTLYALAESDTGIDNWRYLDSPIDFGIDEIYKESENDVKVVLHENGYIYCLFNSPIRDDIGRIKSTTFILSRSKDLISWERLNETNIRTKDPLECIIHPKYINNQYCFFSQNLNDWKPKTKDFNYNTIDKEILQNGDIRKIIRNNNNNLKKDKNYSPVIAPIETSRGWLHLNSKTEKTLKGYCQIVEFYLTSIDKPWEISSTSVKFKVVIPNREEDLNYGQIISSINWILDEDERIIIYFSTSNSSVYAMRTEKSKILNNIISIKNLTNPYITLSNKNSMIKDNIEILYRRFPHLLENINCI